jgi:hypothetical protein
MAKRLDCFTMSRKFLFPHKSAIIPSSNYPYFKDCLRAIDGTHVQAHISLEDMSRFMDRLEDLSLNVLAVVI